MQLHTYISDLLYRYDCVTLPGFGAFLTQRVSATFQPSTHSFYPPKKVIAFNEQIQYNDGLLANYIASVEQITYDEAVLKISKQVNSIHSFLLEGQTLSLNAIGDMTLNAEGKIVFEPSSSNDYLTDAFGLSTFTSHGVQRDLSQKEVEVQEERAPLIMTIERRRRSVYFKYAAIAVVALTVGGFTASTYYNNQIESYNQLAQEKASAQLDAKVQEATFVIHNPLPAVTLTVAKQVGNYHIIAGAYRLEENAQAKVDQLQELGYKARSIGENKYGLHEVVYGSFETSREAINALHGIRKSNNPDAWLLVRALD